MLINPSKSEIKKVNSRFSENALNIIKKRYLIARENGTQETPAEMFARIADDIAKVEIENYGKTEKEAKDIAKDFYEIMANKEYTPGGRTVRNAGVSTALVANCIVLPINDSMESIFQTLKDASLLQQLGSGLGFDFSSIRPAMFSTKRTQGIASGPVSFLKVYDNAFGTIKQQSRHGANIGYMRIDHPDILDFISCKQVEGDIRNFNISISITDEFMKQLEEKPNSNWMCRWKGKKVKPRKVFRHPNGSVYNSEETEIKVKELYDMLVEAAWNNGEPGIAFVDTWNKSNPLPHLGELAATNPCGEQALHPYDNCNLGSINLAQIVKDKKIDFDRLKFVTRTAVRLMDNVIDRFDFPVSQVTELAKKNRRIGLGMLGFADMLYQMEIGYASKEGVKTAEKVMGFINKTAYEMSQELAKEKGKFPNWEKSVFYNKTEHSPAQKYGIGKKMRNAALTTVAPTGSVSMMLDASSGIEPNFAIAYTKQDKDGNKYRYFNRYFQEALDKLNIKGEKQKEVMDQVMEKGSVQDITALPKKIRDIFVVSMDISGKDHMEMQAAFQRNVDNSISKTINFPNSATKEEIADTFVLAWKKGCKSATVYRDGSRQVQILNIGKEDKIKSPLELSSGEKKQAFKEPRPRPDVMVGKTYRSKTGYGNLYVTINEDEKGNPFEVFAVIGKTGGFFQEQSEAICRLISLSLRSGVDIKEIIENIKGIRGPMPVFTDKGTILSLPDALGKILEHHIGEGPQIEEAISKKEKQETFPFAKSGKSVADYGFMPGCPECGAKLVMEEGCINCKSCGFTRCM